MDLIVPLSEYSLNQKDNECRYMLRSVLANFSELGKIFIVGHRPKWLNSCGRVVYLPYRDAHATSKDSNIICKIRDVCLNQVPPSEELLVNSDDQIFCRPVTVKELRRVWLGKPGLLNDATIAGPKSMWHVRLLDTMDLCQRLGWPTFVFEVHLPYIVQAGSYGGIMSDLDWYSGNGLLTHIYFNALLGRKVSLDKIAHVFGVPKNLLGTRDTSDCGLPEPTRPPEHWFLRFKWRADVSYEDAKEAIRSKVFINFDDAGFSQGLQKALREKFPEPAPWESEFDNDSGS